MHRAIQTDGDMIRLSLLILLLLTAFPMTAQTPPSWEQVLEQMSALEDADEEGANWEDSYELLQQLAEHPIDLNTSTREQLEQLPFLSSQQVMDIMEYLYRYGPMRSMGELRMVRSLDYRQLTLLPYFVFIDATATNEQVDSIPTLSELMRDCRQALTATVRLPLYERKGDRNGYLGYRYRHSLRYELTSGQHLRAGFIGAQDAGEPFFAGRNRWGYDAYSYYVQLKQMGTLENLIVGKYKLAAGMGLVLGQSFQLGKLATLQSLGRTVQTIRPHSSRSEADYFHGVATTLTLYKDEGLLTRESCQLSLSAFASYRPVDATLTADGEARTLISSGYHRTPTEMEKKYNTHITSGGTHLAYTSGALRVGATAVLSHIDRELQPQRSTLYRRHYAHGSHFTNMSIDYAYMHHRLALSGETAVDGHGALATIHALSYQPSARISLMTLQRFFSYRYTSLYGHAFSEGGHTQNESGIYLGATWNPLSRLTLQGYADYAYFPWARYGVSQSSHATDLLIQATWQHRSYTLLVRHRSHLRQKDNDDNSALVANNDHRERLALSYQSGEWNLKTQADMCFAVSPETERGWMLSQQATWNMNTTAHHSLVKALQLNLMAAIFDTDSYQSRIYTYERQLQHEFYFPNYYGEGLRLAVQGRTDLGTRLRLAFRIGYTNYFDRSIIGSGLQQIDQSHQTDVDLQLRWKL